jgi:glutamate-1-semialdehyde 2,1-aminomutase
VNIVVLIQSRVTSERFPNKVLEKIEKNFLFDFLYKRLIKSKLVNKISFVIPSNKKNFNFYKEIKKKKYLVFRGSEKNVLNRYYKAAKLLKADIVVRITGDCPLVDSHLLDTMISRFVKNDLDFLSNNDPPTFPDGFDIEIFKFKYLKKANLLAKTQYDKEHVTPFIKRIKNIKKSNLKNFLGNYSNIRLTVDEKMDIEFIKRLIKKFNGREINFKTVIDLYKKNKSFFKQSLLISRNEGSSLQKGQKLWIKAKNIIAGNNMLFSKKSELFLPKYWPAYYKKTKGCKVTDLNGNNYFDLSLMGVGTNILGYSNHHVDKKIMGVIKTGNMSTLNNPDEVELAEMLLDINKWADQVKFARTGAEASAIAIRLGRAASGKDNIAFCGYHGWHDWYLASQLNDPDALEKNLMADLQTEGVPKFLKGTSFPFRYNNIDDLKRLVSNKNIGVIIMEVSRNVPPEDMFLQKVKNIAKKNNIVLIFDECSSGFRETFGGINIKYNINPDIIIFGKALGNGYAINAIVGEKKIMNKAENTFISSTFWTERIGYAAGIATLKEMHKLKSWKIISEKGDFIKNEWKKIADKYKLEISITGLRPMISFRFNYAEHNILKTFITQEMLIYGFLASNTIYVSIAHSDEIIKKYLYFLEKTFFKISKFENFNDIAKKLISKQPSQSTFKRLN